MGGLPRPCVGRIVANVNKPFARIASSLSRSRSPFWGSRRRHGLWGGGRQAKGRRHRSRAACRRRNGQTPTKWSNADTVDRGWPPERSNAEEMVERRRSDQTPTQSTAACCRGGSKACVCGADPSRRADAEMVKYRRMGVYLWPWMSRRRRRNGHEMVKYQRMGGISVVAPH